jgi:hypothetical protein
MNNTERLILYEILTDFMCSLGKCTKYIVSPAYSAGFKRELLKINKMILKHLSARIAGK